jgi:hypothetical protein
MGRTKQMILSKKEKEQIEEMIALEKIIKDNHPGYGIGFDAAKKWHDYPDKLKDFRREKMR